MILFSQDRTRMLNFLSDVFEFEVDEADFSVTNQNFAFIVESHQSSSINNNIPQVQFSFHIKNENELNEIVNKFNFFLYRRGEKLGDTDLQEKIEVSENEYYKSLTILDIDNRPWRFDYMKKAQI